MVDFTYKNISITGASTLDEAHQLAAVAYLRNINLTEEPTQPEIDALVAEIQNQEATKSDFRNLPNWSTWTGPEAADALKNAILSGMTKQEARDAIDAQFAGLTTLAQVAAATITVLKQLSDAVIDSRDVGHQNEAKAIMYLRDIVIE